MTTIKNPYALLLPRELLLYFEIVNITSTDDIIHIFVDEKKQAPVHPKYHYRPNGFCEETIVNDFPIRGKAVKLHIRRRRWIEKETNKDKINPLDIKHEGTHLSKEFAAFLKDAYRG